MLSDLQVVTRMELIVYGCGDRYNPRKFKSIKNNQFVKPNGGLWACPIGINWDWKEWCKSEDFRIESLEESFKIKFIGNLFVIDQVEDLISLLREEARHRLGYPNFETILSSGIDAIYLTERGQEETRFSDPSLYGWDCECILILNPKTIESL